MDDWLVGGTDIQDLEQKLNKLLKFCRKINLKLAPSKMEIGRQVTGDVFLEPRDGRVDAFQNLLPSLRFVIV